MATERIKNLMTEAATKREAAKTFSDYEKWDAVYTALKNQWNKKTGNELIITEVKWS